MKKGSGKFVSALLGRLVKIGFILEIMYGFAYVFENLGYLQVFGETAEQVAVSGTFVCSVYTGVLYPAVLLLIRTVFERLLIPWYSVMYLLQISLGICAGYIFLKAFGRDKFKNRVYFLGSLAIASFPLILQSHMAVLPDSVAFSFLILEVAYMRMAWGSKQMTDGRAFCYELGRVALFWMLAALTEWDFIFIGAIPLLALFVRALIVLFHTDRKAMGFPFIIIISFIILTVGSYKLTEDLEKAASPAKSIEISLFDRVCWKSFLYRNGNGTYDLWKTVGSDVLEEARNHRGSVKTVLEPAIEEKLGVSGARKYFLDLSLQALKENGGEILNDTAIDIAGYLISPVIVRELLSGKNFISYTARNYDIFKRNDGKIGETSMDFGLLWFEISLMIACVLWILKIFAWVKTVKETQKRNIAGLGAIITACVTGVFLSVRNTFLGSGIYDYKLAAFTTALWFMFIFFSTGEEAK